MGYWCILFVYVIAVFLSLCSGRTTTKTTASLENICGPRHDGVVFINSTGPGSVIEIRGTFESGLPRGFNCVVKFVASPNNSRISYSIQVLDIPHTCKSFLKLWGEGGQNRSDAVRFCEEFQDPKGSIGHVFKENSFFLKMQTHRDDWGFDRIGFVMTVTALRKNTLKRCLRDEHPCSDGETCLYHRYACDGVNNCGDSSDEKCLSHILTLVSIVFGAILSVVAIILFIYYIRRRRRLRPYDSSRATSMQSIQSDTSLFGTVKETYYKPLYPIGEGRKIKLDDLPKDPDEPFLPPQYMPQQAKVEHVANLAQIFVSRETTKSLEEIGSQTLTGKGRNSKKLTRINRQISERPREKLCDVKRQLLALPNNVPPSDRLILRRESFPPTRRPRAEVALINEVDLQELKNLSKKAKNKRFVLLPQ